MASNYGDIPTMISSGIRHITKSGTECLCGHEWRYGTINRAGKAQNIIWRTIESVTCKKCKEIYNQNNH